MPCRRIKGADRSVTNVADQDVVAERAKARAGLRDSPRCVQCSARGETAHEITDHVENIDDTVSGCENRIMLSGVLHRISYKNLSSDHLNPERGVSHGQIGIGKGSGRSGWNKARKKGLDESTMEVGDSERRRGQ